MALPFNMVFIGSQLDSGASRFFSFCLFVFRLTLVGTVRVLCVLGMRQREGVAYRIFPLLS
jgi:hypothetical protein